MITHSKATKDTAVDGRSHEYIIGSDGRALARTKMHGTVRCRVGYSGEWKRSRRGRAGMWAVSPAPARRETQGHLPRAGAPHHPWTPSPLPSFRARALPCVC
jgi:hypothetical protein